MIDLCQHAVSVGEKAGAEEIEAVWTKDIATSIQAQLGEIDKVSAITDEGMRIRVIINKALGCVYTYRLDTSSVEDAVKKAVKAARASKEDEYWDSLPWPGEYPQLNLWDDSVKDIDAQELMEPVTEMLQAVPDDVAVYLAVNEVEHLHTACANSNGIEHEDKGTIGATVLFITGKLKDGVTPGFQKIQFMRKYDPRPQELVDTLLEQVTLFKKPETAESGKSCIIFDPYALEPLLQYTLFESVSGENVARGKSLLAEKEGDTITSDLLTLTDNGIHPKGIGSREIDDEGIPSQDTPIIEDGVLTGFIWNDYWAKRVGGSSTGNAHYNNRTDEMSIKPTTMVLQPGDYTQEELCDIKDGYYILGLQGAHGSNPESGDFSVVCSPALKIRNGEITGGVTGMMLSDNIYNLLTQVDAVGNDSEVGDISILPSVRFQEVNIAAK
ncbi:MAG: TldD/PmbA family protein [Candidatus Methanofastidiosia archaeon]|jgi:PmbA protein